MFRRRKDSRPGELIHAARDIFVERGFAATRLEDVAEKAGVSKGTIYLYYKSKDALFLEVIKESLAPALETIEALAAETDQPPLEQLRSFLGAWLCIMNEAPIESLLKILATESGNSPEAAQWFSKTAMGQAKKTITSIVEAGIASGDFRPTRPEIVAYIFASPLCNYIFNDIWGDLSPELYLGEAFDVLIQGLGKVP